jgi:hypothetical protein
MTKAERIKKLWKEVEHEEHKTLLWGPNVSGEPDEGWWFNGETYPQIYIKEEFGGGYVALVGSFAHKYSRGHDVNGFNGKTHPKVQELVELLNELESLYWHGTATIVKKEIEDAGNLSWKEVEAILRKHGGTCSRCKCGIDTCEICHGYVDPEVTVRFPDETELIIDNPAEAVYPRGLTAVI